MTRNQMALLMLFILVLVVLILVLIFPGNTGAFLDSIMR